MALRRKCSVCQRNRDDDQFYGPVRRACKECENAATKERYRRDPERWKKRTMIATRLREYGLTDAAYQGMLSAQDGCCAICADPMKRPCVDHDHATGAVRELLCPHCNLILGNAKDSPEILRSAANYLERHASSAA